MLAEYQMIAEEMSLDTLDTLVDCDYEQLSNEDKTAIADAISEAVTDKKQPGLEADDCKSLQKDGQTIELNLETETPELTYKDGILVVDSYEEFLCATDVYLVTTNYLENIISEIY